MPAPRTRYGPRPRCTQFVRQWRLAVLLRTRARTLEELAGELGCTVRTVRRDLVVLRSVPLPICRHQEALERPGVWWLGAMPEWPRNEVAPVRELAGGSESVEGVRAAHGS